MIRPYNEKKLNLKVEKYLINQVLKECLELKKIIYQRAKSNIKNNVNK